MMVFKRKQIVILSLVLMIVVAGYLQYTYNKSSVSVSKDKNSVSVTDKDSGRVGEAVYVDNKEVGAKDDTASAEQKAVKAPNTAAASKQANDFFAQAKLDKESSRSKNQDALKQITEDANASKDVKAKAYDEMMKLIGNSDKETRIETLLKEKGFNDAIAIFGEDDSIDIVVKAPNLTSAETAQISDIVSRQAKLQMSNIHIKNIY